MKSENYSAANTREICLARRQILAATALAGAIGLIAPTAAHAQTTAASAGVVETVVLATTTACTMGTSAAATSQ